MGKKIKEDQLDEIISALQRTCDTLNDTIQEVLGEDYSEDDLSEENRNYLDGEIFLCADCGWWYEVANASDEVEDEAVCSDCGEERNYHG